MMGIKKAEEFEVNFMQDVKRALSTNLTAKGQNSIASEKLTSLVNKVSSIAMGKKVASGSITGSGSPLVVRGLAFKPSFIYAAYTPNYHVAYINVPPFGAGQYSYYYNFYNDRTYDRTFTIYDDGFSVNMPVANQTFVWIAVE